MITQREKTVFCQKAETLSLAVSAFWQKPHAISTRYSFCSSMVSAFLGRNHTWQFLPKKSHLSFCLSSIFSLQVINFFSWSCQSDLAARVLFGRIGWFKFQFGEFFDTKFYFCEKTPWMVHPRDYNIPNIN